ncbi:elongin-A isoform X2 [Xenopus laevis]|uniref:Elongin-A isoform X2 n=1 Tax=Xenopus laevis TaxID=8355 RepID=A0A8J0VCL6_XENLA|nr:elongin-A isoform X2 [Xenopus laevis]
MDSKSIVLRVQKLKERLGHAQDTRKINKALSSLKELDITLDILVETGIGKTVNGLRKHSEVGDVAKSIVVQWKKLVPEGKEEQSNLWLTHFSSSKDKPKIKNGNDLIREKLSHTVSREKTEFKEKTVATKCLESGKTAASCVNKKLPKEQKTQKILNRKKERIHDTGNSHIFREEKSTEKMQEKHKSSLSRDKKSSPKDEMTKINHIQASKGELNKDNKMEGLEKKSNPTFSDDDYDSPTMSFESYLNYDQISIKRKKRSSPSNEPPRKVQVCKQYSSTTLSKTETTQSISQTNSDKQKIKAESPTNECFQGKIGSLSDLLNVPLPKFLPDYSIMLSPPQATDHKDLSEALTEQSCESSCFTGRRLNSKMQVYSGSKIVYLPKMLTLYEQCIRVLQNNIDSIQEVGGVPFDIFQPVLERCTPEQLNRIEECNPVFIEDSGPLWKKHCAKDFKSHKLLEYETWREMYLRLFGEREEKLKMITQNISSAHSGKPKGRQVKLAYINGVAKPPRNIRRRQEILGTAGPIVQPHPIDKLKQQKNENKDKCVTTQKQNTPASMVVNNNIHSGGPSQDPKKTVRKIAPMMAKSMRAFKNRVGPR